MKAALKAMRTSTNLSLDRLDLHCIWTDSWCFDTQAERAPRKNLEVINLAAAADHIVM
jgi:hypothetical protein